MTASIYFIFLLNFNILTTITTNAALPPGYEDQMFCPPKYCLGRKHPGAGIVGSKSIFWECRFGTGSETDSMTNKPLPIVSWGPKLSNADEKLKEYHIKMYHSNHCKFFHGKPKDGVYTVAVDDYDDQNADLLGLDNGPSLTSLLLGAAAVLCFIIFCCVSSALGASNNYSDGGVEMRSDGTDVPHDLEATIDVDKTR